MKKFFSILFAFLFIASLTYAQDMDELKKKVQVINNMFAEKMVSGDVDELWQHYADDVIAMPSYEPMVKGLDANKKSWEGMKQSGVKMTTFKTTVTDLMKYGDLVVDIGTYEITMSIPGMDQPWNDHGKYLTLWEMQEDGSIKIKVETWNTDVNPWMEMQEDEEYESHEGHKEMEKEDDKD
jgi:ketosteroid isomerase-like protein